MSLRRQSLTLLVAVVLLSVTSVTAQTNQPPRLVASNAGQFTAHTPDAVSSSVLCVLASQLKREWLRRLDLPDKWRDPIVLVLTERPPDAAAALGVWQEAVRSEVHLKFQIQLRIPPALDRAQIVNAVVAALCDEYANREREFPRQPPFTITAVPPWLAEGLAQSIAVDSERLVPLLRRSVLSGRPVAVEELIGVRVAPTEPGERQRFQLYSWALVEGLLSLPKGAERLCQLLREPEMFAEIYRWQFRDDAAREKWWSLLLAERASAMIAEGRAAVDTSRQLAAILPSTLQMRLPDAVAEAPVAFEDLGRYTNKEWLGPLVRDKLAQLSALRSTAHPSYRDVVDHYIAALRNLSAGQVSRFQHETKLARRAQAVADEQSRKISEYVNQVEQVHAPPDRSAVSRQLKLLDAMQEMNLLRRDPISDYLDKFDK